MTDNKKMASLDDIDIEHILKFVPGYVFWKDLNSVYLGCNQKAAILGGFKDPKQVVGKTDYDLPWSQLKPETVEHILKADRYVIETGEAMTTEDNLGIKNSSGIPIVVMTQKMPLYNKKGEIIGVVGISIDITAEKEAERSKIDIHHILKFVPGYVYWKDLNSVYLGCNQNAAILGGLKDSEEAVGKTDYDSSWGKLNPETVEHNIKADKYVIETGESITTEENLGVTNSDGIPIVVMTQKRPLYNKKSEIVGVVGISIDITEQKEAEKLKIENAKQKTVIEQEEKFRKLAYQVVHDVQSPLTTLSTVASSSAGLAEKERVDLRRSVGTIRDTTRHLLQQYQKQEIDEEGFEEPEAVLVSMLLSEILTAKRYEYKSLPIQFSDAHVNHDAQFAFVRVQRNYFGRMVSNLINNAVDAFDGNAGEVTIGLAADDEWVRIVIQDSGKGMPPEVVHKIMNKVSFTSGKASGHGIGFMQIWETLEKNYGELDIDSTSGKGTIMTLTFPRTKVPNWCADGIVLEEKDTVIILDDDPSIHGAWDLRFEGIAKQNHSIAVHHFQQGSEALAFIHRHSAADKEHIFLLSDYELIEQEKNGLEVIAATGLKRALLVTSHYADREVQHKASDMKIRILPKSLAPEVSITISEASTEMSDADIIILDDNESFARSVANFIFRKSKVDQYHQPEELLRYIHRYTLDTRIFLDNNYDNSYLKGTEIAEKLHELGYKRLYLVSGEIFEPGEIPDYLTVVSKHDIENMRES